MNADMVISDLATIMYVRSDDILANVHGVYKVTFDILWGYTTAQIYNDTRWTIFQLAIDKCHPLCIVVIVVIVRHRS